jgi:site-specific DNA recombinase
MQSPPSIRCFEYARKSSEGEDRQVQSIERQQEENAVTIERFRLTIVDRFSESKSAKIPHNRPAFTEMIKRIKKGQANGIVCWHLNRLARNPEEAGVIQQMLADGVIQVIHTKDRQYLPTDNLLLFSVESGMSAQFSIDLSRTIKSGLEKRLRSGNAPYAAPIGYKNYRHPETQISTIVPDKARFPIVQKMWAMMLTGAYIPKQILQKATNEWGLRTAQKKHRGNKELSLSSMYRILGDPFYAGHFMYKGQMYKGSHKPMITLEQFDQVQELLGRTGRARPKKQVISYTGTMTCGECGCAITVTRKTKFIKGEGLERSYEFYHCTRKKKKLKCTQNRSLSVEEIEAAVKTELEGHSISPNMHDWIIDFMESENPQQCDADKKEIESIEKEVARLTVEIKNLLQVRLNGAISDDEFKNERELREAKRLRLEEHLRLRKSVLEKAKERFSYATNLAQKFTVASLARKKEIFTTFGSNHELKDKKLVVSKHKWLEAIAETKDLLTEKIGRQEPEESLIPLSEIEDRDDFVPKMWRLIREAGSSLVNKTNSVGTLDTDSTYEQ